jgi:cytochrome c biogenesis factor
MVDAHLGTIGVWLAFITSIVGAAVIAYGLARPRPAAAVAGAGATEGTGVTGGASAIGRLGDGRMLAPVLLVGALLAVGAMEHALVTHNFALVFVAENNSSVTPLLYSITGMWSALAGSILFGA